MVALINSRFLRTITLLITIFSLSLPAYAKYSGGTGEPNDPYQIATAEDLMLVGETPEDYDKHFILTADIDLDPNLPGRKVFNRAVIAPATNRGWNPPFSGVFDGGNHEISGLVCSSPDTGSDYVGIFGQVDGQLIDLTLRAPNIDAEVTNRSLLGPGYPEYGQLIGGLVGLLKGSVSNCHISGGKIRGNASVGGLVGSIVHNGEVIKCTSSASVRGNRGVGGLAGVNSGEVYECFSSGTVEGTPHPIFVGKPDPSYDVIVGGLVGTNRGTILNCHSNADVRGHGLLSDTWAVSPLPLHAFGGLTGLNTGTIAASCASGKVLGLIVTGADALGSIGGLIGMNEAIVSDCYSTGEVDSGGGLVGSCESGGIIDNCYTISKVSGKGSGLVEYSDAWSKVRASFWSTETSGQVTSSGGIRKTEVEMKDPNTFLDAGWDFIGRDDSPHDVWFIDEGSEYPYPILWWQVSPLAPLPFLGGTGELDDPYLISDTSELNTIGHNPRLMNAHFRLISNIDLTGTDFHVIGSRAYSFSGVFDGNHHLISNFGHTSLASHGIGLFRHVQGYDATIKNVTLLNPKVSAELDDNVGSLVGILDGLVSKCHVDGGYIWGNNNVGGLVGAGGTIRDCTSSSTVNGNEYVGGLVGSGVTVINCVSFAAVSGVSCVGGLIGSNLTDDLIVENSCATGYVVGHGWAGGLLGGVGHDQSIRNWFVYRLISGCYSTADVNATGNMPVGGLAGGIMSTTIVNCYTKGDILYRASPERGNPCVGGVVGSNRDSAITNCYAAGNITVEGSVWSVRKGGLVGTLDETYKGTVSESFWDTNMTGLSSMCGYDRSGMCDDSYGKATSQMQTSTTFLEAGWDFVDEVENGTEDIWKIWDGHDYPRLHWEIGPNTPLVFVDINDPAFYGQMSKYEVTNAQYCDFLNAALASGDITVNGTDVEGASGSNSGEDYAGERYYRCDGSGYTGYGATNGGAAHIHYSEGAFIIDNGFGNHPVTYVSWYGAMAFANYYGYYLPTEEQWQAVADYDSTYIYGCGETIDPDIANYRVSEHPDGTTPVGSFGIYGYGMSDMAGNVWEWVNSASDSNRIFRGGSLGSIDSDCDVSIRGDGIPHANYWDIGFRVCR